MGGDSGIDITAYKDELPPRILVQVKSQDGDIKETTIQSLKGAMREGDYGLFGLYHFFCGMSHPTYINGGSCR